MRNELWNYSYYLYISTVAVVSSVSICYNYMGDANITCYLSLLFREATSSVEFHVSVVRHIMFHDHWFIKTIYLVLSPLSISVVDWIIIPYTLTNAHPSIIYSPS